MASPIGGMEVKKKEIMTRVGWLGLNFSLQGEEQTIGL
jgi:hypothetical protein